LRITPFSTHLWGPQRRTTHVRTRFFETFLRAQWVPSKSRPFWIRKLPFLWHMPEISSPCRSQSSHNQIRQFYLGESKTCVLRTITGPYMSKQKRLKTMISSVFTAKKATFRYDDQSAADMRTFSLFNILFI
jgi:hypothetical protein